MQQLQTSSENGASYSKYYLIIAVSFVACLITANIIAVKLADIAGFILPAAVIVFPVSYILGDVLTEVYGYQRARLIIWLGFFCNLLAVIAIWIGGLLPPAGFWDGQPAYERILGHTPRLLAASFAAYLVGEFSNAFVLAKMKIASNGRWLWARTIASTLVGQALDSAIFILLAFSGTIPLRGMFAAIITQWLLKSAYEAAATPLTYLVISYLKRKEGIDVYDHAADFNPFLMS